MNENRKCRYKVLEKTTYYPVYCFDCQYTWYVENKDGVERCPRCGSANTNKGKNRKDELSRKEKDEDDYD